MGYVMTIHADILPFAIQYWNSNSETETLARMALVNAFEKQLWDGNSVALHGVSRSKAGDNVALVFSKEIPETRTLERKTNTDRRNQSFSVSTTSKRVKLSMVDNRMLRMRTDAEKMVKAANMKRQNNRTPLDALQRIEGKITELLSKLAKAIAKQADTTVLDALIVKTNYFRHRELVRLAELQEKGDEKDTAISIALSNVTDRLAKLDGQSFEYDGNVTTVAATQLGNRPIMPASLGKSYKVKRRVLKDRPSTHGEAQEKVTLASGLTVSRVIRTNGAHASKRKPGKSKAEKLALEIKRINKK